jgi:hypothetical protein
MPPTYAVGIDSDRRCPGPGNLAMRGVFTRYGTGQR